MQPVPLNQLFELALDEVTMLGGNASSMTAIMRGDTGCDVALIAHMRALIEKVLEEGNDWVARLDALSDTVDRAETDLEAAGDAAEAALQGVTSQAPTLTRHAEAMDTDAQEKVAEIGKEREAAVTTLDEGMVHAREDAERVVATAEALAGVLATRIEETRKALGELQETARRGTADLAAAVQRFLDAADEVDRSSAGGAALYVAGIEALMQEEATQLTTLANAKVEAHNGVLGPLRQRISEEEPAAISDAVQAVIQAMAPILWLCDKRDDDLLGSAEKCESLAESSGSTLEHIVTFVEFVLTL